MKKNKRSMKSESWISWVPPPPLCIYPPLLYIQTGWFLQSMCFCCYILPHAVVESRCFLSLFIVVVVVWEWIVGGVGTQHQMRGGRRDGTWVVTNEQRRRPILSFFGQLLTVFESTLDFNLLNGSRRHTMGSQKYFIKSPKVVFW